ncbi:MAG: radical SAM protein [candidate division WOR-3 bacterium]
MSRLSGIISIHERPCRTALGRTGIPGGDYCLNPYLGCSHGCRYCYAAFMAGYFGIQEPWGSFVAVKVNLPEVLEREVRRKKPGRVLVGTVCDPYQPLERTCRLTRRALEILGRARFRATIMTKSILVLDDLDFLKGCRSFDVEMTVTTLDERAREFFEPGAPASTDRLEAVRLLRAAGVEVTIFLGPLLPHFSDTPIELDRLVAAAKDAGASRVLIDKLNYLGAKFPHIRTGLKEHWPEALRAFELALQDPDGYDARLRAVARDMLKRHSVPGEVLF